MGSVNIDNTGSGADVTLSSDGTDLLLDGTAIGGGGAALELYAENPVTPTAPSATGDNAVAIGHGSLASGDKSIALGWSSASGVEGVSIAIDNNTTNYGARGVNSISIGKFSTATNTSAVAVGETSSATGNKSSALGYNAVSAGTFSHALTNSYASGADSFAAAIANNTSSYGATGANSVAVGYRAKATGQNGAAIGGTTNTASGLFSFAAGPSSNIASGTFSVALGDACEATTNNAFALGHDGKSVIQGKFAYGSGKFSTVSDAQNGMFVLRRATTDATATQLTTNNGGASTTNQIILPNNSAYAFHGTIVARQQASAGTASAAWKVEGLIRREGSAGTTVLVNSATTVLDNTPGWGLALSADTTNGGLKIEATGAASTNIRWVATIHTSEVTYA